jgi:hypothetical protein
MATSKHSTSVKMVYLDAALLIVSQPDQVLLNEGENFLACTPDKMDGTTRKKKRWNLIEKSVATRQELT